MIDDLIVVYLLNLKYVRQLLEYMLCVYMYEFDELKKFVVGWLFDVLIVVDMCGVVVCVYVGGLFVCLILYWFFVWCVFYCWFV